MSKILVSIQESNSHGSNTCTDTGSPTADSTVGVATVSLGGDPTSASSAGSHNPTNTASSNSSGAASGVSSFSSSSSQISTTATNAAGSTSSSVVTVSSGQRVTQLFTAEKLLASALTVLVILSMSDCLGA